MTVEVRLLGRSKLFIHIATRSCKVRRSVRIGTLSPTAGTKCASDIHNVHTDLRSARCMQHAETIGLCEVSRAHLKTQRAGNQPQSEQRISYKDDGGSPGLSVCVSVWSRPSVAQWADDKSWTNLFLSLSLFVYTYSN